MGDEGDELLDKLATRGSSKFLGLFRGVFFDYEVYDENVLARDLERVERYYRALGYYEAAVRAARVVQLDARHVRVEIEVRPGVPVVTGKVTITGLEQLPFEAATAAWKAVRVQPDEPFDEQKFEATKLAVVRALADRSYAFAKIKGSAVVDIALHRADVKFDVNPGPRAEFGPIKIVGLKEIPEKPVLDSIYIRQGEPYSLSEIEDAHAALVNLGVFATVDVHEEKAKPETRRVPVIFRVQEGSLRAIRAGVGAVVDPLRVAARLRIGWQDRNFLGDMRDVLVELQPSAALFPLNSQRLVNAIGGEALDTCCVLPGNRALIELRRPSLFEARTAGSLRGEYNIYPLLFTDMQANDAVIRYDEIRASAALERAFFHHHLFVRPSLNFQLNVPGEYQTEFDSTTDQPHPATFLDPVRIHYPELVTALDFRDDPINPKTGFYLGNSLQVAGFGGTVSDVRVQPEARGYLPLTRSKKVVLAARVAVGFLFPSNYSDQIKDSWKLRCPRPPLMPGDETLTDLGYDCPTDVAVYDDLRQTVVNDQHKMLFRGFYSGGSTSNRGYGFRDIGPHGPLGILVQSGGINCIESADADECVKPLGGLSLWESSLEVRFPLIGEWRGVTFLDASNVSLEHTLNFGAPHLSAGFGVRYLTPVGPFRFDLGYRIPGAQDVTDDPPFGLQNDSQPEPFVSWLPVELHLSLGEAF